MKYILPLQNILKNTLSEILSLRYSNASKLVKNIMVEEYKLQTHLKLLRSVYMMEAGHVMNKFYQILFYEVNKQNRKYICKHTIINITNYFNNKHDFVV